MKPSTFMTLNGLQLIVKLGWPKAERDVAQKVVLDISIAFPDAPKGCITDQLADTFCYAALTQHIKEKIKNRSFRLLEYFAAELYQMIKAYLPTASRINITVTKKPHVPGLTGGVSFQYGDVSA